MQFGYIAPTRALSQLNIVRENDFHLVLAHLIQSDQAYVDAYVNRTRKSNSLTIMDNSGFELYKQGLPMFEPEALIELAYKISADVIVLPDYPAEHSSKTKAAAERYAREFRSHLFKTFYVPQSKIRDLGDLINNTIWALTSELIDYVGISILAVPNAYGVEQGNNLQRYLSRFHFMQELEHTLHSRFGYGLSEIKQKHNKKIHFLGMVDGPREIELMSGLIGQGIIIDTWDSSSPVWAGYNNVRYDNSPTGLIKGKIESHVHFGADSLTKSQFEIANANINVIDNLVSQYNLMIEYWDTVDEIDATEATHTSPFKFKYDEGESLKEIEKYVMSTYGQHYVADDEEVQLMDLIKADTKEFIAFNRWNGIKYLQRWGKKDGYNRKDLLKTIHYTILLLALDADKLNSLGDK